MDERLLEPGRVENINIALTSRCNLRCIYCPTGHGRTHDADLSPTVLGLLKKFIAEGGAPVVGLGHVGETTMFEGWEDFSQEILDSGCAVTMLSNFARPFRDEELAVLIRFASLAVSVDTLNPGVLKEIRRKLDIKTVIYNLSRIKAACLMNRTKPPRLGWVSTLSDRVAGGIEELFCLAVACGATSISFHQLLRFTDAPNDLVDVMDLPRPAFLKAFGTIKDCVALAREHGVELSVGGLDVMEALARDQAGGASRETGVPTSGLLQHSMLGELTCHVKPLEPGQTRMCFMPWVSVYVNPLREEGDVYPCCSVGRPLGRLEEAGSMEVMLRSEAYRRFRAALLEGNLPHSCRNCPIKAPCAPSELESCGTPGPRHCNTGWRRRR